MSRASAGEVNYVLYELVVAESSRRSPGTAAFARQLVAALGRMFNPFGDQPLNVIYPTHDDKIYVCSYKANFVHIPPNYDPIVINLPTDATAAAAAAGDESVTICRLPTLSNSQKSAFVCMRFSSLFC